MRMHRLVPRISLPRAQAMVLSRAHRLRSTEEMPLWSAAGRMTAERVVASIPVPPFPSANVDGYAVRAADLGRAAPRTPVDLTLVGEIHAGEVFSRRMRPGETVAVATGAPVPEGADTVEMFERVEARGTTVRFRGQVPAGHNVDAKGADLARGTLVAGKGVVLTPPVLGALGVSGVATIRVVARPKVAILAHGQELAAPGTELRPGHVFEMNTTTLSAVVTGSGGLPLPRPPVPDNEDSLEEALRSATAEADLVVISGGSSVGERDLLGKVFPRLGTVLFHGIRVRPGMPTIACVSEGKLVLGMPGHPASCLVNALWLVGPVVRKLGGYPGEGAHVTSVTMAADARVHGGGFTTVVPLRVEDGKAWPTFHGSHFITSLAGANGYAIVPPARRALRKGDRIDAQTLDYLGGR